MAAKCKRIFALYALYARMDLRWFLQDFKSCLLVIFSDIFISFSSMVGIFLLAERFSGVGDMNTMQVLFMLGFYTLSDGALFMMLCSNNVHQISRRIGRGQVDHMLIQPVPLWMQLLTEGFMPVSGSSMLIMGLITTCYATARLGILVTPAWVLLCLLLVFTHVAIEMGLSFLLASSAFYKPVACEEISSVGHDLLATLGRYPLSGLPQPLIGILVTVLPAGLMAWFPSLVLLGKAPPTAVILPVLISALLITSATHFFRKGLKYYEKVGSNRYRDMGHRG